MGKQMAETVYQAMQQDSTASFDSSTNQLLAHIKQLFA
jgi:glucose-6-phosphate isomerase